MKKIESFTVNHIDLFPGLYLSRVDQKDNCFVSTFDLRFTAPNREEPLYSPAIHTIEHIGATYLRNSAKKEDIVYFGPMGCRTGFYLVMFGKLTPSDVFDLVVEMAEYISTFNGEIPGATPKECGNYSEQDLEKAKEYAKKYLSDLTTYKRTIYPQ